MIKQVIIIQPRRLCKSEKSFSFYWPNHEHNDVCLCKNTPSKLYIYLVSNIMSYCQHFCVPKFWTGKLSKNPTNSYKYGRFKRRLSVGYSSISSPTGLFTPRENESECGGQKGQRTSEGDRRKNSKHQTKFRFRSLWMSFTTFLTPMSHYYNVLGIVSAKSGRFCN